MRKSVKDLGLAGGLILFFLFTLFLLIPRGIYVPSNINIRVMSPDFFPRVVSVFLTLLSVILAFQSFFLIKQKSDYLEKDRDSQKNAGEGDKTRFVNTVKTFSAILFLFIYYESIFLIGILPSSIIFLVVFSALYGERRFKITIPLAIILSITLYFFFTKAANIPLPKGVFFD